MGMGAEKEVYSDYRRLRWAWAPKRRLVRVNGPRTSHRTGLWKPHIQV